MYQLRTRLIRKCARYNAAQAASGEQAAPSHQPASQVEGNEEPYRKWLRIRRSVLETQDEDKNAWVGEVDGTADPISDLKLVRAIMEMKPHAALTAGDVAMTWHRVITCIRERAYARTLCAQAPFGVLLRVVSQQADGDDRNTELRAMLLQYCESVEHQSPAMARFVQQFTDAPPETHDGDPRGRSASQQLRSLLLAVLLRPTSRVRRNQQIRDQDGARRPQQRHRLERRQRRTSL